MAVSPRPRLGVALEQALHGYEDGHRLLAASTELTADDRRLLARQTDSPDAGRVPNWEALLAGHPLPSGRFALSMTWPAPEMPRPGCVWTHTLILDQDTLASASGELLRLFRRPAGPEFSIEDYRAALTLRGAEAVESPPTTVRWSEVLAWSVFEPPERPVRAFRMNLPDDERHELLVGLWTVGWPDLRAAFSFCDAPRTQRLLDDRPFDLQLHHSSRVDEAEAVDARVLRGIPEADSPSWARQLAREMLRPTELTKLINQYGPDLGTNRKIGRAHV